MKLCKRGVPRRCSETAFALEGGAEGFALTVSILIFHIDASGVAEVLGCVVAALLYTAADALGAAVVFTGHIFYLHESIALSVFHCRAMDMQRKEERACLFMP